MQVEADAFLDQAGGQQLGCVGVAGSVDVAVGAEGVEGSGVKAVGERQGRLLHRVIGLGSQLHEEGLDSPGADVEAELVPGGRRRTDGRFVAVQLLRGDHGGGEADGHVPGLPALEFVEADDIAAAVLGLLEGAERHAFAANFGEAEGPAQSARVARNGEGLDRLVQGLGAGGDAALPPVARVGDDRVGEPVLPVVLAVLVGIAAARLGRMEQRQAKDIVGGLVPAVFAVVEDGDAVGAVRLAQVRPLLGIDLILFRGVVRTL